MTEKLIMLAARRENLIARAATQRITLAKNIAPWRTPLALVDRGLSMLRFLKHHPVWIIGGVSLLVAFRPSHCGLWLRRGWALWQITQKLPGR